MDVEKSASNNNHRLVLVCQIHHLESQGHVNANAAARLLFNTDHDDFGMMPGPVSVMNSTAFFFFFFWLVSFCFVFVCCL